MIRYFRRNVISIITCSFIVLSFCYFFFHRFDYFQNENEISIISDCSVTKTTLSDSDDPASVTSLVNDYELSRFLLPNSDRQSSAVENGNLSFDEIRRHSSTNSSNRIRFDAEGVSSSDVLIFLHIQKTGGTTFERYLVRQLAVPRPCQCRNGRKRCQCRRPSDGLWLFSRFSNGWPCGLHADYTELIVSGCVHRVLDRQEKKRKYDEKATKLHPSIERRYFLTTFLREPVARYYSEYRHVTQRGATWSASLHFCNGRRATNDELPPCYDAQTGWVGATLNEFLDCPSNLANNRQTRMLADLTLVNCYNRSGISPEYRDATLLRSAKVNLRRMAYFGLQEDMRRSQYVFERTFGLEFNKPLMNWNDTSDVSDLTSEELEKIERANRLDLELYKYAKKLFEERFRELKTDDPLYDLNIAT